MKRIKKLNFQLFLTITILIVGSIIAFAIVLPISSRYFIENKIYKSIEKSQENLLSNKTHMIDIEGVYHMYYPQLSISLEEENNEELLHQKIMYKGFFEAVKNNAKNSNNLKTKYKYTQGNEIIYYIIDKSDNDSILISYKIDHSTQVISHQLFMNILIIATIIMSIIFIIFFKWNNRLINNLKDIQEKLDLIGEGNLKSKIEGDKSTVEFEEVMNSLESMRKKLYENEQVKQGMIHNISHDLKTPLAVIKNYAEGIIDGVYPYGTVEETAHVIYDQADRLQNKVQGLLYLNRLEYIKSQNETYGTFNMSELVSEVVGYMQDRDDNIHIQTNLNKSYFYGDIEQWRVVLENLIDNAKRYVNKEIIINVEDDYISIYNDGTPIDDSLNGSLFKPFEVGKGGVTGLGLSIVKKTVELYGYDIHYKNELEGGVTFTIFKIT
ncbi:MAG: sensor histidine kinase [Peptostreptococcaceae bacterium]